MKVAIIGAGWAGLSAAVQAAQAGHQATVFEAARQLGGRARVITATLPNGDSVILDNGQHILIGAYAQTLALMQTVGVDPGQALLRLPLALKFPDGTGLALPDWPSPLNAIAGIVAARGWGLADKASLLRTALGWRQRGFVCAEQATVAQLCRRLTPRVMQELIEPLCVSALNIPADRASGRVFLVVMRDSLFGGKGSSDLLLPRVDLTTLFPQAAADWVVSHGGDVRLGLRVERIQSATGKPGWTLVAAGTTTEAFDAVVVAVSPSHAAVLLSQSLEAATALMAGHFTDWLQTASQLSHEAITTVYAWGHMATLARPMLALRSAGQAAQPTAPAQFVFDRGQLGGPAGLLAFVISASTGERDELQAQVISQAKNQLRLTLQPVQTVVEKRATFACTPDLRRPPLTIAPGLLAAGDYVDGPYPATLEGAVRSGLAAARAL